MEYITVSRTWFVHVTLLPTTSEATWHSWYDMRLRPETAMVTITAEVRNMEFFFHFEPEMTTFSTWLNDVKMTCGNHKMTRIWSILCHAFQFYMLRSTWLKFRSKQRKKMRHRTGAPRVTWLHRSRAVPFFAELCAHKRGPGAGRPVKVPAETQPKHDWNMTERWWFEYIWWILHFSPDLLSLPEFTRYYLSDT